MADLIDNKEFVIVGINISQKPYLCVKSEISQHLSFFFVFLSAFATGNFSMKIFTYLIYILKNCGG